MPIAPIRPIGAKLPARTERCVSPGFPPERDWDKHFMRKRYRSKRRSCALCKPHKRGHDSRWTARDRALLSSAEKEIRRALRLAAGAETELRP